MESLLYVIIRQGLIINFINSMEEKMNGACKNCSCFHHKMMPLFVILFGLVFLLFNLDILSQTFVDYAWPIIVIVAGLTKMFDGQCKCC
jgi:hypothetical protein